MRRRRWQRHRKRYGAVAKSSSIQPCVVVWAEFWPWLYTFLLEKHGAKRATHSLKGNGAGHQNQNAEKSILIYLVGYFFQEKYSGTNYRCTLSLCLSLNLRWVDLYIGTRKFHVQVYMAWQSAVCLCLIFHIRHEECELYRFQNLWLAIDSILFALVSYSILLTQTRSPSHLDIISRYPALSLTFYVFGDFLPFLNMIIFHGIILQFWWFSSCDFDSLIFFSS